MGNCLQSSDKDPNPTSTAITNPPTPGSSNNNFNTNSTTTTTTTTDFSATSSSAGRSQFSRAVSEGNEEAYPGGQILEFPNLKVFTFADLKSATKNFKADTLVGEGGFGRVYKGWIDERTFAPSKSSTGMLIAVKKLNPESMQGFQEWKSEVNFLGRLSHPNLVKLLGYCWEEKELLLVYEFMQKGSLENHLFRRNPNIEPLSWDMRLKIVLGAARGLAFLHASEKQIIYRDFKASNILLDEDYNAKISDFGLAKLGPSGGDSHVTTRVMGSYGYAAPEYIATGNDNLWQILTSYYCLQATLGQYVEFIIIEVMRQLQCLGHLYVKSDVYGFGVVLLEMLTGLRALDTRRAVGRQNLVDWMQPSLTHKRRLKSIMDTRMEGQYSSKAMVQAAQLTVKCLESDPRSRPSMAEVVEVLEQIEALKQKSKATKSSYGSAHSTPHARPQQPNHHRSPFHWRP